MTCGLEHASYSLREWQAVKLAFFASCPLKTVFIRFFSDWPRHSYALMGWRFGLTSHVQKETKPDFPS